jgi:uncharacterized protein
MGEAEKQRRRAEGVVMMPGIYHEGELLVQSRAGGREIADQVGEMVQTTLPPVVREFLSSQPMAVSGTVDSAGRVWASLLAGPAGFLAAADSKHVQLTPRIREGDPILENLRQVPHIGLLVIELATRRRARINGVATSLQPGKIVVRTSQVYPNCSKYIQAREWLLAPEMDPVKSVHGHALTSRQQQLIRGADTFFIATSHFHQGADASHRGGSPGFITVTGEKHLQWPDYKGNSMYQTLGNIAINPAAGLLFVDWERGSTLQLSGSAHIVWEKERVAPVAGAERIVEFHVSEVIEITGGLPLQWRFLDAYPYNPR